MTRKGFDRLRFYSNVGFDVVSAALTINFMISIPKFIFEKIFYFIFGASIEGAKLYLAALVKDNFHQVSNMVPGAKRIGKTVGACVLLVVYLGTASFSDIMSTGYVLYTVKQQSDSARVENFQDNFKENQITTRLSEIATEIQLNQEQLSRNPAGYGTVSDKLNAAIARLQAERLTLTDEYQTILEGKKKALTDSPKETKIASDDIFAELGSLLRPKLDGPTALTYIMLALTVLLEVFIFITMGKPEDEKLEIKENSDRLRKYIASMFEGSGPGKRLRSDYVISKELGIPIKECEHYRELISGLTYKGRPLLIKTKTSTSSSFNQDAIEKIVFFNLDIGGQK